MSSKKRSSPNVAGNNLSLLRTKAEEKITKEGKPSLKIAVADIVHELNVHVIELEMQNEELSEIQSKLMAALKEYSELFELSPVGYFLLNENGIIEKVNERGSAQLAIEKFQLIGKPFLTFLKDEFQQDNFYRYFNLAIKSDSLMRLEAEIKRKDGSSFFALIKSKLVKNEKQEFKHLLLIISDIQNIKDHERQIEQALVKAEELNELKSRFVTMASHEFRTPLSVVLSGLSLIERYNETGEKDKVKKHLERIDVSVRELTNMLDEYLSLEKLENGVVEITRSSFNLPEFCEDVVEDVRIILKKGQHITCKHIGTEEINGDKKILYHVLQNLLSNASKYSGEGQEIILNTNVSHATVTIKVIDKGIGIPQEEQANIFSSFFRAQNVSSIQGTGLGLNIVKRYMELLGGTISFISEKDKGTTFIVEFPLSH